jgi:hypothetical protein
MFFLPALRAKQLTYGSSDGWSPLNITVEILRVIKVAQIECEKIHAGRGGPHQIIAGRYIR